MTPLFPAQRRAEEFDQVLAGTATAAVADRYAGLLATVTSLRTLPEVSPRPAFVAALRGRLMAAAETDLVAAPPVVRAPARTTPQVSRSRRRLSAAVASLVVVGGTAGMAAASSGALPGEALYPVKRGTESLAIALRFGDSAKGSALLGQAATRLQEVHDLQANGPASAALVAETIDSFRSSASEGADKLFTAYQAGGDSADITRVRTFTSQQMAELATLSPRTLPSEVLVDAADTLAELDQQARVLCGDCGPRAPLLPPANLSAEAAAAAAANLLARPVTQAQADIALADARRLAQLQRQAESTAPTIPQVTPVKPAGPGGGSGASTPARGSQVTSTITGDGDLVSTTTTSGKNAVKGLVAGVTGTLTSGGAKAPSSGVPSTPLDPAIKRLHDALEGATGSSGSSGSVLP